MSKVKKENLTIPVYLDEQIVMDLMNFILLKQQKTKV